MVYAEIVIEPEPVEELIEYAGTLEPGARVPADHFGLIGRMPLRGRYVRAGERVAERCDLYRIRRVLRRP